MHVRARRSYYEGHLPESELAEWEAAARSRGYTFAGADLIWLCAELDGRIAGFALATDAGELLQLQVDPARWEHGVGDALHRACVEAWRGRGVSTAHLDVFEPNTRAREFYRRRGWREVGLSDGEPVHVRMALAL
ncbi:hypothetical protein GCM10010185_12490 [Saccharothrix coeruleofusca]|uniref:N-acetyltransferase domain-containing protein n=1 Tax=Saccharothrix coeruleofusca TaxID=33919 RepID=A0A918AKT8_9PSEU|nr:hypothetical protein GCM10010185_12490 [Saccharothrix coeruleofusca]